MSKLNSLSYAFRRQLHIIPAVRSKRCFSISLAHAAAGQSIDEQEVTKFNDSASNWWGASSSLSHTLHSLNALRIPLVRNALVSRKAAIQGECLSRPLSGMTVLDVGCGGGILSEPLARLGAQVTGIDASPELINAANRHADQDPDICSRIKYVCSTTEELCMESNVEQFDGVVASEVIEHVADRAVFVSSCCRLVKPGGSLFFTTINRTLLSHALAVVAAEYVLGVVPRGTHDWNKFVSPKEIEQLLASNFSVRLVNGIALNPFTMKWCAISNTAVNYMLHAVNTADNGV